MSILKAFVAASPPGAAGTVDMDATIDCADIQVTPADALAQITFGTAGGITYSGSSPGSDSTWGSGVTGADYEIRATVTSGSVTSGTTGSWLGLGTARSWSKSRTSDVAGSDAVVMTIEIRDASTLAVRDTATVTLTATVESAG